MLINYLKKSFSWIFLGYGVFVLTQWGILIIFTKNFSSNKVGSFILGISITTPLIMFFYLQLRVVLATDVKNNFTFEDYLGLRIISLLLFILVLSIFLYFSKYDFYTKEVIFTIGIIKTIEGISDIVYGLFQKNENMKYIGLSFIIKSIFYFLSILFFINYIKKDILFSLLGPLISALLVLKYYDLQNFKKVIKKEDSQIEKFPNIIKIFNKERIIKIKKLFYLAFPLGLILLLISLNINMPRYYIEHYLGKSYLGIFGAISYIAVGANIVIIALGQSALPSLSKLFFNKELKKFIKFLCNLLMISLFIAIIGILISIFYGKIIIKFIYKETYAQHSILLVWIMIGIGISFLSSLIGFSLTAIREFKVQLPIFFICTIITFISSNYLIPNYKLIGASFVLILNYFTQFILSTITLTHFIIKKYKEDKINIIKNKKIKSFNIEKI